MDWFWLLASIKSNKLFDCILWYPHQVLVLSQNIDTFKFFDKHWCGCNYWRDWWQIFKNCFEEKVSLHLFLMTWFIFSHSVIVTVLILLIKWKKSECVMLSTEDCTDYFGNPKKEEPNDKEKKEEEETIISVHHSIIETWDWGCQPGERDCMSILGYATTLSCSCSSCYFISSCFDTIIIYTKLTAQVFCNALMLKRYNKYYFDTCLTTCLSGTRWCYTETCMFCCVVKYEQFKAKHFFMLVVYFW